MSNNSLETIFQVLAAVLLGVAAIFLYLGNYEGVFVSAILSSVSYFLSFRFQVKERLDQREAKRVERELDEMNQKMLQENKSLFDVEEADFDREEEITTQLK